MDRAPIRIAHAYGNRRTTLEEALNAPLDMIEADIWYRAGDIWVRHERRLGPLPLLIDRRQRGVKEIGPYALPLGPWFYLRLDIQPLALGELLERCRHRRRLLLDTKGRYSPPNRNAFAQRLTGLLREHGCTGQVVVCGKNWPLLDEIRGTEGELEVRYSIEEPEQWARFQRKSQDRRTQGICISRHLLTEERTRWLEERGIPLFCWTVDDPEEAARLLGMGVQGIISNDLSLLASLSPRPRHGADGR